MSKFSIRNITSKVVQINQKGPDSFSGEITSIKSDYIVLKTNDALVLLPTFHLKSISYTPKESPKFTITNDKWANEFPDYFLDFCAILKHHWMEVTTGGPNKVEGILVGIRNQYIVISVNDEIVKIAAPHIKSIILKSEKKNQDKDDKKDENKSEKK